jgi:micrococcal nuclease
MNTIAAAIFFCAVSSVTDGDTWKCQDGTKVRLWGVNAAELKQPDGKAAREWLKGAISGRVLACAPKGESFDRVVARCIIDGRGDVGALVVDAGQGTDCPRYSKGAYAHLNRAGARYNERMCG